MLGHILVEEATSVRVVAVKDEDEDEWIGVSTLDDIPSGVRPHAHAQAANELMLVRMQCDPTHMHTGFAKLKLEPIFARIAYGCIHENATVQYARVGTGN